MDDIHVRPLTQESFQEYGRFVDLMNPRNSLYKQGEPQFYSDLQKVSMGTRTEISVSVGAEMKRSENLIQFAEFHSYSEEGMLALDGDVIIYTAPATRKKIPPFLNFQAFYVPRGVFVVLKTGIWHGCQLPVQNQIVHNMILLPELTYANDTYCYYFKEDEQIKITCKS